MYQATLGSSKTQYPVAAGGAGPVPALPGFYSAPAPGQVTAAAMQKIFAQLIKNICSPLRPALGPATRPPRRRTARRRSRRGAGRGRGRTTSTPRCPPPSAPRTWWPVIWSPRRRVSWVSHFLTPAEKFKKVNNSSFWSVISDSVSPLQFWFILLFLFFIYFFIPPPVASLNLCGGSSSSELYSALPPLDPAPGPAQSPYYDQYPGADTGLKYGAGAGYAGPAHPGPGPAPAPAVFHAKTLPSPRQRTKNRSNAGKLLPAALHLH